MPSPEPGVSVEWDVRNKLLKKKIGDACCNSLVLYCLYCIDCTLCNCENKVVTKRAKKNSTYFVSLEVEGVKKKRKKKKAKNLWKLHYSPDRHSPDQTWITVAL